MLSRALPSSVTTSTIQSPVSPGVIFFELQVRQDADLTASVIEAFSLPFRYQWCMMAVSVVAPTTLVKQYIWPTLSEKTDALAIGARFSIDRHMMASANWILESVFSWAGKFMGIKASRKSILVNRKALDLIGFIITSPI